MKRKLSLIKLIGRKCVLHIWLTLKNDMKHFSWSTFTGRLFHISSRILYSTRWHSSDINTLYILTSSLIRISISFCLQFCLRQTGSNAHFTCHHSCPDTFHPNVCNSFVIIGLNVAGIRFKFGCVILCSVYLTNLNIMSINIVKLYKAICRNTTPFFTN